MRAAILWLILGGTAFGSLDEAAPAGVAPGESSLYPPAGQTAPDVAPAAHFEAAPAGGEFYTRQELSAELKRLAWTKDSFKFTPYGTLWANTVYETERSRVTDYCLYIDSPAVQGEPAFGCDCKSTRLGLDMAGPPVAYLCGMKLAGKVEIDFQGIYVTRNKPDILLRHAYLELRDDDWRLLAGQTWDVISPLGMPVLNYTAGSAVGNLAYRRAQFRGERFLGLSDTSLITLQGAMAVNVLAEYYNDPLVSCGHGPYPDLQGRVAWTLGPREGPKATPVVLGVSSHIGESTYDFLPPLPNPADDVARRTWSFNADFTVPLTDCCGLQGEFFTGENLCGYFGGVLQGVDRRTHAAIRANGGWIDFYFDPRPDLHTHWGYAIDDPFDQDLTSGRTFNEAIYANWGYDITKFFNVALEVSSWNTGWVGRPRGEALRLEIAARYRF